MLQLLLFLTMFVTRNIEVNFKFHQWIVKLQGKIISHPVPPYAMVWTANSILIGGVDKRVVVYNKTGKLMQTFDFSKDPTEREFTAMTASPSGQTVLVGSYDRCFLIA